MMRNVFCFALSFTLSCIFAAQTGRAQAPQISADGFIDNPADSEVGLTRKLPPVTESDVQKLVSGLDTTAQKLRELDKKFPGRGFGVKADKIARRSSTLHNCTFVDAPSLLGGDDKAFVIGGSMVFLTPSFYNEPPELGVPPRLDTQEKIEAWKKKTSWYEKKRLWEADRMSILLHEAVHVDQGTISRKLDYSGAEKEAYKDEYDLLVALGASQSNETTNALQALGEYGVIVKPDPVADDIVKNGLDDALKLDPGKAQPPAAQQPDFKLPPKPVLGDKLTDEDRQRIGKWREDCLAELNKEMEEDPLRIANRDECLAIPRDVREMTCTGCGKTVKHWWIENSWCCPVCEKWTYPIDLKRADGKSYTEFASERKKIYEGKMEEIRKEADKMLGGR
jgi:hypothetical protein